MPPEENRGSPGPPRRGPLPVPKAPHAAGIGRTSCAEEGEVDVGVDSELPSRSHAGVEAPGLLDQGEQHGGREAVHTA